MQWLQWGQQFFVHRVLGVFLQFTVDCGKPSTKVLSFSDDLAARLLVPLAPWTWMFERELSEQSSSREGLDLVSNIMLQIPALPPTPPPPPPNSTHLTIQSSLFGKWRKNPYKVHKGKKNSLHFSQHCEVCSAAVQPVHGAWLILI